MIQNSILIEQRHKRFIKTVCETEIVYALKDAHGYATSSSVHYEDDGGKPIAILCFWAEHALAKSCIQKNWKEYQVSEIPLNDFMENWCLGMEKDRLLVGTEFGRNMFGYEADPLEVILALTSELQATGKHLNLKRFDGVPDMEKQIKQYWRKSTNR